MEITNEENKENIETAKENERSGRSTAYMLRCKINEDSNWLYFDCPADFAKKFSFMTPTVISVVKFTDKTFNPRIRNMFKKTLAFYCIQKLPIHDSNKMDYRTQRQLSIPVIMKLLNVPYQVFYLNVSYSIFVSELFYILYVS